MDSDVFRRAADDEDGVTVWEARFTATATAPADDLKVTIAGYDNGRHEFGPVVWSRKRSDVGWLYPQANGRALVCQSDQGTWWVLEWLS